MVTISEGLVGWLLSTASRGKPPHLPLGPREHAFRKTFNDAICFFGLQNLVLKPYSLRRGGATFDFAVFGDLPRTLWEGRWASAQTGRLYIQKGVAVQAQMRISETWNNRMDCLTEALKQWVAQQGDVALAPLHGVENEA